MELSTFPLLVTFLVLLFLYVNKGRKSRNPNLPPGPSKLPIIGSLHHLVGLPHSRLRDLARKYGPLMHLKLGEINLVVVSSPKMAQEVMKTHDIQFANRPVIYSLNVLTYGCKDIVHAPYGEYWRQVRKICTLELLSAKRVLSFQSVRQEETSSLLQYISSKNGSVFNLTEKIFSWTNDVTARAAFGKKCKDKDAFIELMREGLELANGYSIGDLYPSFKFLPALSGMKKKAEEIHRHVNRIFEDILKEHKESYQSKKSKDEEDLVDVLLRFQEEAELGSPITDENVKAILLDIFVGASDTSSVALDWAMSEMLRAPKVLEKAQAEVRRVHNGKDETNLNDLVYFKFVIKEILRLHPSLPLLIPRQSKESCQIDGYDIPAGTKVVVNGWAINRDPEHWVDADKFNPDRFDEIFVDFKGTKFEYIPFGAGRRICPGITFGIANIEFPLAQLLYHYDWKLPNGMKPEELDMTETFGATVGRKNPLYVSAIPYSPE